MERHFNLCLQLPTQDMKHHTYVLSAEELTREGKRQRYQQLHQISSSSSSQVRQTCLFIPNIVAIAYRQQSRHATPLSPGSLKLLEGNIKHINCIYTLHSYKKTHVNPRLVLIKKQSQVSVWMAKRSCGLCTNSHCVVLKFLHSILTFPSFWECSSTLLKFLILTSP